MHAGSYLAADTAYGSAETLNWVVNEKRIAPHIPVVDKSGRENGSLSRESKTADIKRGRRRAMYGRRPRCKRNLTYLQIVRVQPCMRPVFRVEACPVAMQPLWLLALM